MKKHIFKTEIDKIDIGRIIKENTENKSKAFIVVGPSNCAVFINIDFLKQFPNCFEVCPLHIGGNSISVLKENIIFISCGGWHKTSRYNFCIDIENHQIEKTTINDYSNDSKFIGYTFHTDLLQKTIDEVKTMIEWLKKYEKKQYQVKVLQFN